MIKLKVPKKPAAESVSIGNYHAELKGGAVIQTDSREWADYLIAKAGCEEIAPAPAKTDAKEDAE